MCETDENLLAAARGGDPNSFVRLIGRHEQPLLAVVRRYVTDPHHREDALQTVLLQAWRDLAHLREPSRFRRWLLQIARNRCRDLARSRRRRERAIEAEASPGRLNRYGRAGGDAAAAMDVRDAVGELTEAHREVVELFYLKGLTVAEISRRIDRPEGTVKSRLHHARRKLRRRLEDGEESRS